MSEKALTVVADNGPSQVVGEVVRRDAMGFMDKMDENWRLAQVYAAAPKASGGRSAEELMVIFMAAHERGIGYSTAVAEMYLVNGKVGMQDNLIAAQCMAAGVVYEYQEEDGKCTVTGIRGLTRATSTFTMEMAKEAGLTGKDNWKKHPAEMLMHRARMNVNRRIAPDIVAGVLSQDEVEEIRADTPTATVVESTAIEATKEKLGALEGKMVSASHTEPAASPEPAPSSTPTPGGDSSGHSDLDNLRKRYHALLTENQINDTERQAWQRRNQELPDSTKEWTELHYVEAIDIANREPAEFHFALLNDMMVGEILDNDFRAKVNNRRSFLRNQDAAGRRKYADKYAQGILAEIQKRAEAAE